MCYASAVSRHPLIAPNGVENPKHLSAKWRDVFASGFPDNCYKVLHFLCISENIFQIITDCARLSFHIIQELLPP